MSPHTFFNNVVSDGKKYIFPKQVNHLTRSTNVVLVTLSKGLYSRAATTKKAVV